MREVVLLISSSRDPVGAAFGEYCRTRGLEVVLAVRQSQTQLYFELSERPYVLLRVVQPDGSVRQVEASELLGVWFRGAPDVPDGLDEEDAIYAAREFHACLIACLRSAAPRCFGYPSLEFPFQNSPSPKPIYEWCKRNGVPVLREERKDHLVPLPVRDYLVDPDLNGRAIRDAASPQAQEEPKVDGIYCVLFGRRLQLLAQDGFHSQDTLARAHELSRRLASEFPTDSAIIELSLREDHNIAVGVICPYVPEAMILRDPAWYFDAVLEVLGV